MRPPRSASAPTSGGRSEAKSGRVYDCGKRSVAGYPFRLEVSCEDASVALVSQTAGAPSRFTARLE